MVALFLNCCSMRGPTNFFGISRGLERNHALTKSSGLPGERGGQSHLGQERGHLLGQLQSWSLHAFWRHEPRSLYEEVQRLLEDQAERKMFWIFFVSYSSTSFRMLACKGLLQCIWYDFIWPKSWQSEWFPKKSIGCQFLYSPFRTKDRGSGCAGFEYRISEDRCELKSKITTFVNPATDGATVAGDPDPGWGDVWSRGFVAGKCKHEISLQQISWTALHSIWRRYVGK